MASDNTDTNRWWWGTRTFMQEACAAAALFASGVGWGCFLCSGWILGAFFQAMFFGLLGRLAWEGRRAGS
jgi:hypothetical protein